MSALHESRKRRVAVSIGDPAGIGCEVALKALMRPDIRNACDAVIVGDAWLVDLCNRRFGTGHKLQVVDSLDKLKWGGDALPVLDVPRRAQSGFEFGAIEAANGHALLAYAETAIRSAQQGAVDCVIAAPQNETSVNRAGIKFDGYPGFVARVTGTPEDDVFLLLISVRFRIAHVTLHVSMRQTIELIRRARIVKAILATDAAVRRMGIARPRIAVSGLNPHAGEHGLFGTEEAEEIEPAIEEARRAGIDATGPLGADVMLSRGGYDAYVVMTHDQGHIPGKLDVGSAGFCIGTPVLFGSVAHGSAHDIAGKGTADPASLTNAISWATGIRADAPAKAGE
jgi:4-hydroxy-L-threonine phosphate dehydrogenase PdxA